MKRLENKVAIVTGAGSGIGKAIALKFIHEGCKVLAGDIYKERLLALLEEAGKSAGHLSTIVADMSKEKDIEQLIDKAVRDYGTLDILVNNAGIMDNFEPVGELDDDTMDRVMHVNFNGPLRAIRKVIPIFLEKGSGNIINICSIGGLKGGVAGAAYTASKFALVGLTKNTGYMYSKSGIRCNGIAPGATETNIGDTIDMTKVTPLVNDRIMAGMVLNPRTGKPDEIANAALFLASDEASFVNGHILVVDGGWTAY